MSQEGQGARRVDRRVRRSRRAIIEAFDRLIMEEPLERITVSRLAREADVDRKTVYQHFGSIDGLLDAIAEEAVSELLDKVEDATRERVESGGDVPTLRAFFGVLADHLSENVLLMQRYCEHVPADLLLAHLARPLVRQVVERGFVSGELAEGELEPLLVFELGGLFALYRWWLLSGSAVPLPELTARACLLAERGVAPLLGERDAT